MLFNLFQGIKVFKDSILKHSVELVLDARENGVLFVDIEAKLLKRGIPVKLVQVKQAEAMNNLAHASLDFSLTKEFLLGNFEVFLRKLMRHRSMPWIITFKSIANENVYKFK